MIQSTDIFYSAWNSSLKRWKQNNEYKTIVKDPGMKTLGAYLFWGWATGHVDGSEAKRRDNRLEVCRPGFSVNSIESITIFRILLQSLQGIKKHSGTNKWKWIRKNTGNGPLLLQKDRERKIHKSKEGQREKQTDLGMTIFHSRLFNCFMTSKPLHTQLWIAKSTTL